MDANFDKVITELRNLREDVNEINEDYELELEMHRIDMHRYFGVKVFLIISMFINGLFTGYYAINNLEVLNIHNSTSLTNRCLL